MADINIGDILYDSEAEGNMIGWVTAVHPDYHWYWMVTWNDGETMKLHKDVVRDLKKEWHKQRKKFLNKKRK